MADKYNVQLTEQQIQFAFCRLFNCYNECKHDVELRKLECKEIGECKYANRFAYFDHMLKLYEGILNAFGEVIDAIDENERMENNV